MLSPNVLQRISELNRDTRVVDVRARLAARRAVGTPSLPQPPAPKPAPALSTARQRSSQLPDGREIDTPHGRHLWIERPLHELWHGADRWLSGLPRGVSKPGHPDLVRLHGGLPDSAMFLDLETCGFAGSMVFLAGLLVAGPEGMTLVQLLARHYGEEQAMLHTFWQVARQQTVLVTFNGKSFDWPTVRDRTTLHRLESCGPLSESPAPHCDLLHASRRRWRRELPNCKLQTLERHVCGRHRSGDIPGREIPDAYHAFVRNGDAWQMRSVLHHNALDLLTLLQLGIALLRNAE